MEIYAWKLKSNWKEDNGNHKVIKIEFKYVIRLNFIMVSILTKWILIGFCFRKMSKHCKFYLQGNCKNGRNCSFFHQEIRRDRYGMLSKTFQTNPRRDEISKESKKVNERLDRSNMSSRTEQGENKPRMEYIARSQNARYWTNKSYEFNAGINETLVSKIQLIDNITNIKGHLEHINTKKSN